MPENPLDASKPLPTDPPGLETEQELSNDQLDAVAGGTGPTRGRLPDIDTGTKVAVDL